MRKVAKIHKVVAHGNIHQPGVREDAQCDVDVGGIGTPIAENVRIHHQPLGALRQVVRARVGLAEDKPAESPITVLNFNKKIESRKCATNSTASMKFGVQIPMHSSC